jgi:hypothetical protein
MNKNMYKSLLPIRDCGMTGDNLNFEMAKYEMLTEIERLGYK